MSTSPLARAVAVVVLLAGLAALGVWFGTLAPAPSAGAYPTSEHLADDYDRYVGERAVVSGVVVRTDPVVVAGGDGAGGAVRYRLVGLDRPVDPGETVWAFGVVEPDRRLAVQRATVVDPWGYRYAWGVSLLSGLWVLGRVLRDWRVDRNAVGLVPDRSATDDGEARDRA